MPRNTDRHSVEYLGSRIPYQAMHIMQRHYIECKIKYFTGNIYKQLGTMAVYAFPNFRFGT